MALSAGAVAFPGLALGQQVGIKRLAFINTVAATDPAIPPFVAAMKAGLASEGWVEGKNIQLEIVYGMDTPELATVAATRLLALDPDVIIAVGIAAVSTAKLTHTVPVVAGPIGDAMLVAAGVSNYAHPPGNVTGLTVIDPGFRGYEMQMLKELAPGVTGVMELENPSEMIDFTSFQTAAKAAGLEPIIVPVMDVEDIDMAVEKYTSGQSVGLITGLLRSFIVNNHAAVSAAVIKFRTAAVFGHLVFVSDGVANYYADTFDIIRRAGDYAGLILKGTKVADLPVQAPTKYRLVINQKVAAQIGITVPESILVRADQVVS